MKKTKKLSFRNLPPIPPRYNGENLTSAPTDIWTIRLDDGQEFPIEI